MATRVLRLPAARPDVGSLAAAVHAFTGRTERDGELQVTGSLYRGPVSCHPVGVREVLDEYAKGFDHAVLAVRDGRGHLDITVDPDGTTITATAPSVPEAEASAQLLGRGTAIPRPGGVRIFIGHGPHDHWRLLADLLRGQHGLEVVTFESAARGGLSVTEVLQELVGQASIAVLVHTRDYLDEDGVGHASDNLVYETGYFQALLGSRRAIVVREEGCAEYANITGVNQLRFNTGDIAAVVGDILAVLRREFPHL